MADADREDAIEPFVARVGGGEARQGAEIIVARIDRLSNALVVAPRKELMTNRVSARIPSVLRPGSLEGGTVLYGKIRSNGEPLPCLLAGWDGVVLTVDFEQPVFAPAPGQKLVLYDALERVVAGGTIRPV